MLSCIAMHLLTNFIPFLHCNAPVDRFYFFFCIAMHLRQILFIFLHRKAPAQFLQVEGLLKRDKTLSEEAMAGNIYLVDYEILKGNENKFDF